MEKILFVNACVRANSRTRVIAQHVLGRYNGEITEKALGTEDLTPLTGELLELRDKLISSKSYDDDMLANAAEFAGSDRIVIAAPFWDLGFPALLKVYLETIMVSGITFTYENGYPQGLCKAKSLVYVTTSGGPITEDFGYSYIKSLANNFFGISDVSCVMAQNMDVEGIDAENVLTRAEIVEIR